MRSRLIVAAAAVLAGLAVAIIVAAISIAGTGGESSTQTFDHISNLGVRVPDLSPRVQSVLQDGGAEAVLTLIGNRENIAFYTAPGDGGGLCYAVGPEATGGIMAIGCPNDNQRALDFPSDANPILDFSPVEVSGESTTLMELDGFAADGVSKVGLVTTSGTTHWAAVRGNLYHLAVPASPARAIIAADASGAEVYHRDFP